MSYNAFKHIVRLTAQLSELTLVFNTWIVSPPTVSDCRLRGKCLGPTLRTIVYGVSEPLYTSLLVRIPANGELSCILILVAGIHLMLSARFWISLDKRVEGLRFASDRRNMQILSTGAPDQQRVPTESGQSISISTAAAMRVFNPKVLYLYAFAQLQLAAACNATFLFVAQNLDVIHIESFAAHLFALVAAYLYFFLSRLGEWYFARSVGLPLIFGQSRAVGPTIVQAGYLVFLIAVRSSVRWLFGLDLFAGAWADDTADVEKFSRDAGILDSLRQLPGWVLPSLFLLGLGLTCLKTVWFGRPTAASGDMRTQ